APASSPFVDNGLAAGVAPPVTDTFGAAFTVAAALRSAITAGTNKWVILDTGGANSSFLGAGVFGANSATPATAAVALEVNSATKVFLPSRLTAGLRDTWVTPNAINGMLFYNSDIARFEGRANGAWVDLMT